MASDTLATFESSLAEYDVPVTRVGRAAVASQVNDVVEPPAVGVALEETFADDAFSLADTDVVVDPTPVELREARTGVTGARLGVADYGTVALEQTDRGSELVSLFVDTHVVVVRETDLVTEMETAIESLGDEIDESRGSAILATGPSATADMGALVRGAHGPKDVRAIVVTEDA
ncbi:LUD domain-containing protein [Haloarcula pellucida]|uniref:Lactate utilization protein C n=1 Tax=Haloarcula pellucida TaxID=1427151 RepID=A0A830GHJ7_9EURY|nr:LUD domain-containing protein [Halomicroarcula pellucida]MBX0347401.1 LUD domain-containing protein [Halomicroarcula pellucida]GGN88477.1 lactate utilization protein C [Halomicroarcula pellucida]